MDSSTLVLGLRVLLALACVLGVLWFLGRRAAGTGTVKRSRQAALSVVAKQSLGGRTGVALVEIGGRRLLLGVSEHGVNLLTEVEPAPAEEEGVRERIALDPAELEAVVADTVVPDDLRDVTPDVAQPVTQSSSTPAARMPAVPTPRNPLEGSILDAATWRQAVVAVQERTIRR
ncbi:flagellar biosynthetic protein FliO [Actinotalea ferrariae]|uniref:flagellar biosynthetic protein FliO n=1 Tax=Actinotalea ferrariae TaxID=1386098 RepID=UPI001C8CB12B|nr:flagellar biosynthetic protein FliO [Actinotalea ferrariae]MBX9245166.1 flagellar biosynthetic protein FliO [Actinotalea ferrariae]